MSKWTSTLPVVALCVALTACKRTDAPTAPATATPVAVPAAQASGNPAAVPVQAPVATPSAIATQPGPDGTQVDLVKVAVVGNLLTVQLAYRTSPDNSIYKHIPIDQVSVIDDSTSQRYSVVKDAGGRYMALPLDSNGTRVKVHVGRGATGQVSFKFPAPPPSSQTVSISVPEVGPFDGVAIQR